MIFLRDAIKELYDGSAALKASAKGGMFFFNKPSRPTTPYIIVRSFGSTYKYSSTQRIETIMTQFTIVSKIEDSLYAALEDLHTLYDDKVLNYSAYWNHMLCRRSNEYGLRERDNDFYYDTVYEIMRSINLNIDPNPS